MGDRGKIRAKKRRGKGRIQETEPPKISTDNQTAVFSFKHFDSSAECPSSWTQDEIKGLFNAFHQACNLTWTKIKQTGGKAYTGNKQGLGYTRMENYPIKLPPGINSEDHQLTEMRATGSARFLGIRMGKEYFVIRLDRNPKK